MNARDEPSRAAKGLMAAGLGALAVGGYLSQRDEPEPEALNA